VFKPREVPVDGAPTVYQLFEPDDVDRPLPLILFLHGAGESGDDGVSQTKVGIGRAVRQDPKRFPALIVFPQASRGYGWRGFNLFAAFAALDDVTGSFDVDPARVYVTGISMGGYGTSAATALQPERFAAAVPICGGMDRSALRRMDRIARIPHWIFHGDADSIIPVEQSRMLVDALRDAGGEVHYTEYPAIGHNSWDAAYREPELMPWMLQQRRELT
jgi:predicted peptidase